MNPSICPRAGRVVQQQWGSRMASFIPTVSAIAVFRGLDPKHGPWARRFVALLETQASRIKGWEKLKEIADQLVQEVSEAFRRSQRALREAAQRARIKLMIERRRQDAAAEWEDRLVELEPCGIEDAMAYAKTVGLMQEDSWATA